jgi:uncharacterized phage protein (TIGR01671 family)
MNTRSIKFRAWDRKAKRFMTDGFAVNDDGEILINSHENGVWDHVSNYPYDLELVQFTGLLDKNGKEIYEGDILEAKLNDFTFRDYIEMGWAKTDQNEYGWHWSRGGCIRPQDCIDSRMEVIGNIYENPELLK